MSSLSTPRTPEEAAVRQQLVDLSRSLVSLHKTLIDSERVGYEQSFGTIPTPGAFLNLLTGDPWFAWLRTLSEFIVEIDETLAGKTPVTKEVAGSLQKKAHDLLTPLEKGEGFALHYYTAMQRDPDVVLAHAKVVKLCERV